jgi:putative lipoic acid-binding regulatory protein
MQDSSDDIFDFPCQFPIKAMGRLRSDLDSIVAALVRRHAPDLGEAAVSTRKSRKGNYVSVTINVTATSRQQLDSIYRELHACEHIIMVL